MTRKIKFRAWDSKNKKWVSQVPSSDRLECLLDNPDAGISHHDIDEESGIFFYPHNPLGDDFNGRVIYQQYTGLNDKNGLEIYEGDVIKQSDFRCGPVEWISEKDGWDFSGWKMRHSTWGDGIEGSEVIGNIFENPELLEK